LLKSLEYSKKNLHKIKKPSTPHNTSQFLSANFSNGRNENVISDFTPDFESSIDNKNGEFFIPVGSMRDKYNREDLNEKNNSTSKSKSEDQVISNEDYDLSSYEKLASEDSDNSFSEFKSSVDSLTSPELKEKLIKYKRIIKNQQKIISILTDKLKRKDSSFSLDKETKFRKSDDFDMD
jgi:hypothetical protein